LGDPNSYSKSSTSGLTGEFPHFISAKCDIEGTGAVELPIRGRIRQIRSSSTPPFPPEAHV